MTAIRNNLVITLAVAIGLIVAITPITPVEATLLVPGGTVVAAIVPNPAGAILADTGLEPFTFGSPLSTGTVREIVVTDAGNPFGAGQLSFVYQFRVATGDVGRLTGSNFTGFLTDVGFSTSFSPPFFTTGTAIPMSIDRSAIPGAVVGFNFIPPVVPDSGFTDTSFELVIRTNAIMFGAGSIGLIDGGGQTLSGFAPTGTSTQVPEPASIVLLGLGAAGIWGYGRKRRRV